MHSPLVHGLVLVLEDRREQVAEHAALPGLDLDRHRHARAEVDEVVVDLHLGAIERDARGIGELLAFGLTAGVVRARHRLVVCCFLQRLVAADGILGDAEHLRA
jgi:hypothetical protein